MHPIFARTAPLTAPRTAPPTAPLTAAFPAELAGDVRAVLATMPASQFDPIAPFSVVTGGNTVTLPGRIYHDEPWSRTAASLTPRQLLVLHCLYTRHHDGRVRQRHLEQVIGSDEPWVVPFVVQLAGEYVLEILAVLRDGLRDLAAPGTGKHRVYGEFVAANPAFFDRTQRRVVSYWSCYHRTDYASFRGYPGCTVLDLLRSAGSDSAGRPLSTLTPASGTRVDGYC